MLLAERNPSWQGREREEEYASLSAHPLYVLGARVHGLVAVSDSNRIDIFACVKPRNLDIQFSFVVNVKPNCAWLPLMVVMMMTRTNTSD